MKLRSLLSAAAVSALIVSLVSTTPALAAEHAGYPDDGAGSLAKATPVLPMLEPALEIGADLAAGVPVTVAVPGLESGAHSALVRITLTRPAQATTVSVAGFPALVVEAGGAQSTTVLAPVVDGQISIQSDQNALVRVERVATFDAETEAPGSVQALGAPVVRADSANGTGVASEALADGSGSQIGVLGADGIPESGVRAVFVSLDAETMSGAAVDFGGQQLEFSAGPSVVSTVVPLDSDGTLDYTVTDGEFSNLRAAVTGYVVEATDNPVALQGAGAFVPEGSAEAFDISAVPWELADIDVPSPMGTAAVLALVDSAQADTLGVLDTGDAVGGRASGVVIDGPRGANQQLVLLSPDALATAHGSAVDAEVTPVGYLLGEREESASEPQITLTSPTTSTVDATDTWMVNFEGTLSTPNDFAQRIEVTLDGDAYGSAHLTASGEWAFDAALQDAGEYEFEFTLVARGGSSASTSWSGSVIVPDEDDVVITDDTVVLDESAQITDVAEDSITFAVDPGVVPGDVLVSGVLPAAPNGLLARVVSVNVVNGQWVAQTEPASLTDMFLQAQVDELLPVGADGAVEPVAGETSETVDGEPVADPEPVVLEWETAPGDGNVPDKSVDAIEDGPISEGDEGESVGTLGVLPSLATTLTAFVAPAPVAPASSFDVASISHTLNAEFSGGPVKVVTEGELKLALKVTIDIQVAWTDGSLWPPVPPLPYPNLKEFSTVLESSATAEATATASVSKNYKWAKSRTFTREFAPLVFSIGPVPLVITSEVGLKLEASLEAKGSAKVEVSTSYARTQQLGFAFKNGKPQLVDPAPKTTVEPLAFSDDTGLAASVSAQAGPTLTYTAKLWDLAGPQIGLSLKAAVDASGSATVAEPFFKASAEVSIIGGFFVKLLVTVPVIDKELLNLTLLEKQKKWSLWKGEFNLENLLNNPGPPTPGDGEPDTDYGDGELIPADEVLDAIEIVGADASAAYFVEGPPHPSAFGILSDPIGAMPTFGSDYIAMSTGPLASFVNPGEWAAPFDAVRSSRLGEVYDATTLRIDLTIPQGTNCLVGLDFQFFSDEYPDFVGSQYNDAFIAEFGKTTWEIDGYDVIAPRNFAFDELGNPITINAAGPFTINEENAGGHAGGATSLLRATTPVLSGDTSLYLSIFDQGDGILDSTVLIDRIEFSSVSNPAAQCAAGVQ
ncbi:MAG: choice-of-anchor L domain-containing protein [Leucobacter sp.]